MSSALNLSLLARGVGEVSNTGQKVDVVLEPSDYHNFTTEDHDPNVHRLYLPPIGPKYAFSDGTPHSQPSGTSTHEVQELCLPKTYITRRGALLLFSEDYAQKATDGEHSDRSQGKKVKHYSFDDLDLHTVDDFAKSILSYGNRPDKNGINLHFVKEGRIHKRVRPGFSARRYLSRLTKTFDESFLSNLLTKGYVQEKTLFQFNSLIPSLRKRINDDLSYHPAPYRIMKQMLMAPGTLSGYTFYRQPSIKSDLTTLTEEGEGELSDQPPVATVARPMKPAPLQIVSMEDGVAKTISYGELTQGEKQKVLADLLVKSAINHALEKQKQKQKLGARVSPAHSHGYEADRSESTLTTHSGLDNEDEAAFNMADAVKSYLENQLAVEIPEEAVNQASQVLKGSKVPQHIARGLEARRQRLPETKGDRHYVNGVPVVQVRDTVGSQSHAHGAPSDSVHYPPSHRRSDVPALPSIRQGAGLVSQDYTTSTQDSMGVPMLQVEPPTPQNSTLMDTGAATHRRRREPLGLRTPHTEEDVSEGEDTASWRSGASDRVVYVQASVRSDQSDVSSNRRGGDRESVRVSDRSGRHSDRSGRPSDRSVRQSDRKSERGDRQSNRGDRQSDRGDRSTRLDPGSGRSGHSKQQTSSPARSGDSSLVTSARTQADTAKGPVFGAGSILDSHTDSAQDFSPSSGPRLAKFRGKALKTSSKEKKPTKEPKEAKPKGSVISLPGGEVSVGGSVQTPHEHADVISQFTDRYADGPQPRGSDYESDREEWAGHRDSRSRLPQQSSSQSIKSVSQGSHYRKSHDSRPSSYHSEGHRKKAKVKDPRHSRVQSADSLTEEELVNTLSEHAEQIAAQILQKPGTGLNIEDDAQELAKVQAGGESQDATVAQYKSLLKESINAAISEAGGEEGDLIPQDAVISDEVLHEIVTQRDLLPDDLEVVEEPSGRKTVRVKSSRSSRSKSHASGKSKGSRSHRSGDRSPHTGALTATDSPHRLEGADTRKSGSVKSGSPSKSGSPVKSDSSPTRSQAHTPSDVANNVSPAQPLEGNLPTGHETTVTPCEEYKVSPPPTAESDITLVFNEEDGTKARRSVEGTSKSVRSGQRSGGQSGQTSGARSDGSVPEPGESKSPMKSREASKYGQKEDSREEFVVGLVKDSSALQRLYGPVDEPPKPAEKKPRVPQAKKGGKKKGKGKEKKAAKDRKPSEEEKETTSPEAPTPKEEKVKKTKEKKGESRPQSQAPSSPTPSDRTSLLSELPQEEEEEEMEFIIIRDEFSESDTETIKSVKPAKSIKSRRSTAHLSTADLSDIESDDSELHAVTSKESRAAVRAAQASKRREEVERKRKDREEQREKDKMRTDEQERLKREIEEERRRKEDERRMKREQADAERQRQDQEETDRERRALLQAEKDRRMKEEYQRKLEEMKKQREEEDRKRKELEEERRKEEEERLRLEEEMLAEMEEDERREYEKKRAEDEERRKIEEQERKLREGIEMERLRQEALLMAQEMARKQAEMEQRLNFNRGLHLESTGMERTQNVSQAFTWSYYELLQWLGLELPDFEKLKANLV